MPNLNLVQIMGHLGRDPELRYTQSGNAVANFSVAVNRNRRLDSGEWESETEWFRCVAWGDLAERLADAEQMGLAKGIAVYVQGRLQTRQYEDREGVTRYSTELVASVVQRLTPRDMAPVEQAPEPVAAGAGYDDLPF